MDFLPGSLLDLRETEHAELFDLTEPAWNALSRIEGYLSALLDRIESSVPQGQIDPRAVVGARVHVAEGAVIEPNAVVQGPAWIGKGSLVRSGAYVRENVIVGDDCILGNSSEFKNCLLLNGCEIPHFNYVGDSILGHRVHLGAGAICSNFRLDHAMIRVKNRKGEIIETGLQKLGAIVGDRCEIGCHAVLNPGSVLGRDCIIYPLMSWSGTLAAESIVKP